MNAPPLTRILYIEDDENIQVVARMALEDLGGFTIEIASSGREGLTRAAELLPNLILLDAMMPVMDGPATFRALRENPTTAGIPVVFMTAKVQSQEVDGYKKLGAIGVIPKPFDPITLSDEIRTLWERHHEHDRARKAEPAA